MKAHSPQKAWIDWLVSPATRHFLAEGRRTPGYSLWDALHGYIYGRFTYLYIGLGIGEHPLAKRYGRVVQRLASWVEDHSLRAVHGHTASPGQVTFADTYHGKVVPLDAARQLVTVNEPVKLQNLESIVPYARARDIILEHPEHIAVLDCPCRSARANPCLPLDVCLIVGEPFYSFVLEHHSQRARPISQVQAVQILQEEDDRGHVHHAFFKDAMLGRFYAICNCCACCCGAMQAQRNGTPMLASSGYQVQVDQDLCLGCGSCVDTCQFSTLSLPEDAYTIQVDAGSCMGCGVCVNQCQQGALSLQLAPERGQPLELSRLVLAG